MQIHSIKPSDSTYPPYLEETTYPPHELFLLGELPKAELYIAIVGSRSPTSYGRQMTYQFAFELARAGAVIVSGLANGIDGVAHQAAIDAGGKTVAVLAHGLDRIYPTSHRDLAKQILATGGTLVSEYPVGVPPLKQNFVARNRIIAGLCQAVIVPESSEKSGSLITANFAIEYGRCIIAVPGNVTSPRSVGPNNLIRAGRAIAATSVTDILTELNFRARLATPVAAQSREEALLVSLLSEGDNTSDSLIERSGLSAAQFANIVSLMEITGKIRNLGAGRWAIR